MSRELTQVHPLHLSVARAAFDAPLSSLSVEDAVMVRDACGALGGGFRSAPQGTAGPEPPELAGGARKRVRIAPQKSPRRRARSARHASPRGKRASPKIKRRKTQRAASPPGP